MQKLQWTRNGKKLQTIPAWQLEKVKSKKEVILEARRDKQKVHFATLTDNCHLKNAELEPKLEKYKGRILLRGDIVKDDSGSYAVFTEQGPSVSQMTAAKVMVMKLRLSTCRRTCSRHSIRLHSGQNGRCSQITENSKIRMSRHMDPSTRAQMAKLMVQYGRPSRSS